MDLFFIKRLKYTSPNPDLAKTNMEYITLTYIIVIDVFTRYSVIEQIKGKGDNQGIKNAFIKLLDEIKPEGSITTIADKGTEFFHLHKNVSSYKSIPIKHLWSQSRYKAAVAEANIGIFKKMVTNNLLDRINPFTEAGHKALVKKMNNRKMQVLDGKTPMTMLKINGKDLVDPVEDKSSEEEQINVPEPYKTGDLVVLRHYMKEKPFQKDSAIPNFDPELFVIDRVLKLPTGTYRYHLRSLEQFDARKVKTNAQGEIVTPPKYQELFSQISFQHGEIYKPTPKEIHALLSFAENDHLEGSYQSQAERDLYYYD